MKDGSGEFIPSIYFSIISQQGFGASFDRDTFQWLVTNYRTNLFVCQFGIRGTKWKKKNHMDRESSAE
jgi:hypothetical protein